FGAPARDVGEQARRRTLAPGADDRADQEMVGDIAFAELAAAFRAIAWLMHGARISEAWLIGVPIFDRRVDAAFGLVPAPPAARARILARFDHAGARGAAD